MDKVSIVSIGSISALGSNMQRIWKSYLDHRHFLEESIFDKVRGLTINLSNDLEKEINELRGSDLKYKSLDKSVLMSIYASRKAFINSGWNEEDVFGINIGSSRGATELFEQFYDDFSNNDLGKTHPLTSPTTTLGNLSTWVADDLGSQGPTISHSITCSTGLHAVLNGFAWLQSGLSDKFMVGATEAPNTAFTISMMQAIKIYADNKGDYPSKALDFTKERNTMCLGEGASVFCMEKGVNKKALALIESVGYATEKLKHNISITDDAECFQDSMNMALSSLEDKEIDIVVMHAPGTKKGDSSEYKAIQKVFGNELPALTSNKWKIGHTLGASGCFSMELAILMLQYQQFINIPYLRNNPVPKKIERIMVNAVGFGGNAVSIVLGINKHC